jgi:hypothetical protein
MMAKHLLLTEDTKRKKMKRELIFVGFANAEGFSVAYCA